VLSAFWVYGGQAGADYVFVSGDGGRWRYPLSSAETVCVTGPLGDTIVGISGGQARIVSSPCRNQLCVAAPPVRKRGQWIACLPNQVMTVVEGAVSASSDGVDAVVW
jgi:hypothetical protein